jgi:hypothetical protein
MFRDSATDDKLNNNMINEEKNSSSIINSKPEEQSKSDGSLMLEQKSPLCSQEKNNHTFITDSQISTIETKNNNEGIDQSSNKSSNIVTSSSSSSFNHTNNIKPVSKVSVIDCDFPKNLENKKELLIGLPVLCCLFCNKYKTPIDVDMDLHLYEMHKKELITKLSIRSRGVNLNDRIAFAIKLMKQDALINKEVF